MYATEWIKIKRKHYQYSDPRKESISEIIRKPDLRIAGDVFATDITVADSYKRDKIYTYERLFRFFASTHFCRFENGISLKQKQRRRKQCHS